MICPACKNPNREGARFCGKCGADLQASALWEAPASAENEAAEKTAAEEPLSPAPEAPQPPAGPQQPLPEPPQTVPAAETIPRRKKKRHFPVVLVILLVLFLAAFAWVGVSLYGSHLLGRSLPASPFTFESPLDSEDYVSGGFTAGGDYELPKGFGKLRWSCKSDYVVLTARDEKSAEADVTRPKEAETVKVFVTCRYLFGLARKSYVLKLAPKPALTVSSVKVPDEYRLDAETITVFTDDAGTVTDISGDLGAVEVRCAEDAETVAEAYRDLMAIPEEYGIVCERIEGGISCVFYHMAVTKDGYPVAGSYVDVVTKEDGTLYGVEKAVDPDPPEEQTDRITEEKTDISGILREYAAETGNLLEILDEMDPAVFYYDRILVHGYFAADTEKQVYDLLLKAETGEVIYCEPDRSSASFGSFFGDLPEKIREEAEFLDSLESCEVRGYRESDTEREHELTADGSFSPATEKYYLIDTRRKIFIDCCGDLFSGRAGLWERAESDSEEFSDSVSLESLKWLQNAYDWYETNFGRKDSRLFGIHCLTNSRYPQNGADPHDGTACDILNHLHVFPGQDLATTAADLPTALYHEYSLSVVNRGHLRPYLWNTIEPVNATIREAYADIFAYWIAEDTPAEELPEGYRSWAMGPYTASDGSEEAFYFRNSMYGTGGTSQLPALYGDYQGDDLHEASVYVSNVAYRMYTYGQTECGLTKGLVQDIWYDSMGFGLSSFEGCDISRIRRNVLKAAGLHGCTEEQLAYIEDLFFDVGIRDGQEERHQEISYISGRLLDEETGLPVADARLILISGGDTRTVFTDSFGGFAVTGLSLAGSRIEYNSFGETGTLYPEITQFALYTVRKGTDENAYVVPETGSTEDEEVSEEINDLLAADDDFIVAIENPVMAFLTRKIDVTVYVMRDYSEELREEITAGVEESLISSGDFRSADVTIKKATKRMIKQVEDGEIAHGLENVAPDMDRVEIRSVEEYWYYLKLYLNLLRRITFYVHGTGELLSIS